MCLPRNLEIVGSNPTRVMTMILHTEGWKRKGFNRHFSWNPLFCIFVITNVSYICWWNIKIQLCQEMYDIKNCPKVLCAIWNFYLMRKFYVQGKNLRKSLSTKPQDLRFLYLVCIIIYRSQNFDIFLHITHIFYTLKCVNLDISRGFYYNNVKFVYFP